MLNRRDFLRKAGITAGFGVTASGLLVPRYSSAGASSSLSERKFLFIFCAGGWDTTTVFNPCFGYDNVDMEDDAELGQVNGISFVDSEERPSVREFFESYGQECCIVNGIEVRSITHERCQLIMMTGNSGGSSDDWPAIIAGMSEQELLLPHLVVYGRAYTNQYTSKVVRVGSNGQLPDLLDGSALEDADVPFSNTFTTDVDELTDAFVRSRVEAATAIAPSERGRRFGGQYGEALGTLEALRSMEGKLNLDPDDAGCMRDLFEDCNTAFDAMEMGLSRCALIQFEGWCGRKFDTHSEGFLQNVHHELLFGYLMDVMADLETRTSPSGAPLKDELTIVLLSEMGRGPKVNGGGGRDHWTYTSAMLLGSGIRGGQVIGQTTDQFTGMPVDFETGEATESGTPLVPNHLGATLLTLAGIDPGDALSSDVPPLMAALDL